MRLLTATSLSAALPLKTGMQGQIYCDSTRVCVRLTKNMRRELTHLMSEKEDLYELTRVAV